MACIHEKVDILKDWKEVWAFDVLYFSLEGNIPIFDHHNKLKSVYMYTFRKFTDTQNSDEQSTQQMVWFLQEVLWTNISRSFFSIGIVFFSFVGAFIWFQMLLFFGQLLQFWHHNNLPCDTLEYFLSEYLDILGYALSLLLIR